MALRDLTAAEKLFFIEKAVEQRQRESVVESVQALINARTDFDAIDAQELIEEILAGTKFVLRREGIDYATDEEVADRAEDAA